MSACGSMTFAQHTCCQLPRRPLAPILKFRSFATGKQVLSQQLTQRMRKGRSLPATCAQKEKGVKDKATDTKQFVKGNVAQILGIRGGDQETNIWKIRLQLTKPVTWIPLIWGVLCGAAASGHFHWTPTDVAKSLTCMLMSGPLLTGYTQTINDYYDKDIDAINEPNRPIPSGAISEPQVIAQFLILLAGGLGVSYTLDRWAGHEFPTLLCLATFGSFISYIYSAPPLKLKQSGWIGNYALGSSYIALPWWAGQVDTSKGLVTATRVQTGHAFKWTTLLLLVGTVPCMLFLYNKWDGALFGHLTLDVIILTILYSLAGLGIAIVNDFKSIEGDRKMGLNSLPVAFGPEVAKWITVGTIDVTQIAVAAYLAFGRHENVYAAVLTGLILPQIFFQYKYFIPDPIKNDVQYQARAQPFLVFGLLTTGLAIGQSNALLP